MNNLTKKISTNALVAVIYFVVTLISQPIAFLGIQIRIAEALVLLCFFRKDFAIGVTLGCILSNLMSPLGVIDVVFGGLATFVSCILIGVFKNLLISTFVPVVINSFVVGAELYFIYEEPFWLNVGFVAIGEILAVTVIGYILFLNLGKKEYFKKLISSEQNLFFKF